MKPHYLSDLLSDFYFGGGGCYKGISTFNYPIPYKVYVFN